MLLVVSGALLPQEITNVCVKKWPNLFLVTWVAVKDKNCLGCLQFCLEGVEIHCGCVCAHSPKLSVF